MVYSNGFTAIGPMNHFHASIAIFLCYLVCSIGRAIINNHNFFAGVICLEGSLDSLTQDFLLIIGWNKDTYRWEMFYRITLFEFPSLLVNRQGYAQEIYVKNYTQTYYQHPREEG